MLEFVFTLDDVFMMLTSVLNLTLPQYSITTATVHTTAVLTIGHYRVTLLMGSSLSAKITNRLCYVLHGVKVRSHHHMRCVEVRRTVPQRIAV